ncbi:Gfo/Idh/MocA family oxidoreductase [Streptomyces sp. NPDC050211]|uniref:Gfo/Idh/MocA family protein n=1 Tax=Streptomyces sp. NPDC050211 TaxID=3154932 RepID=UPI00343D2300
MKILIVGMGYAGSRFLSAFRSLDRSLRLAYHARHRTREDIPYFPTLEGALAEYAPDVVVVAATDSAHADILTRLGGYRGFVLAEKPLTSPHDDLDAVAKALTDAGGFALDLVERYSDATEALRAYVGEHELRLVRAHLTWGKDRINDHRPTVGVTSEVIHSLDLVRYVMGGDEPLRVRDALGVTSDFSVSGPEVLDSVALTATLGTAPVTVYSSFTNIVRQRTVDLAFRDREGGLVHVSCVYDTPVWDADHLRVWRRRDGQEHTLCEVDTGDTAWPDEQRGVVKLRRLALDVVRHVADGTPPRVPFAGLAESVETQRLLNDIETAAQVTGPASYFPGGRTPVTEVDWERLG